MLIDVLIAEAKRVPQVYTVSRLAAMRACVTTAKGLFTKHKVQHLGSINLSERQLFTAVLTLRISNYERSPKLRCPTNFQASLRLRSIH